MRHFYSITSVDSKLLQALKEKLNTSSEVETLQTSQDKYTKSNGLTRVPLHWPGVATMDIIDFYNLDPGRLVVTPKDKVSKKECFQLKSSKEYTDVTAVISALDLIDNEQRDSMILKQTGTQTLITTADLKIFEFVQRLHLMRIT
jgi:hypothetical protein